MKESEAWEVVARAFELKKFGVEVAFRYPDGILEDFPTKGLCGAIGFSKMDFRPWSPRVWSKMKQRMNKNRPPKRTWYGGYWWPYGEDEPRMNFAMRMSRQARKEENALASKRKKR